MTNFLAKLKLRNTNVQTKICVVLQKRLVVGLHIQMQVKIKELLYNDNLKCQSKPS